MKTWNIPVFVLNVEDSRTLQQFAILPKIEDSKKNLKQILKQKREYEFKFPLLEHDNRIGPNHFLRHEQGNDADYYKGL